MAFKYVVSFFILYFNLGYSQSFFQKDRLTILADSLHLQGFYDESILLRKEAINSNKDASRDYKLYLKAKYFHTNSCLLEDKSYNYHNPDKAITKKVHEQYLDSALQYSVKARDLYIQIKNPDRKFQYNIQNRIYHQTAYLGNWKYALEQAQLGYQFLKDTLSKKDKTFVDLIYDIGFIYSELGDYSRAVDNYKTSLDLYKSIIGENNTDVAQAYNNIAVEYRNLGLHNKELESLLKAKTIWETLNADTDKHFIYSCYGNLFYWYSYYGDFDKAEEYILKKEQLREEELVKKAGFIRNKEEIYEDKLHEWYDLMLHYSRKNDTLQTEFYAKNIIKTVQTDKKLLNFETSILSATLKFYASFIKEKNQEKALQLLDKAIAIQQNYNRTYYTNAFPFLLEKVDLLLKSKKTSEAELLLKQLDTVSKNQEILQKFKLSILKAKMAQQLNKTDEAQYNFDEAFQLLKNDDSNLEETTINNLKPLVSFAVIDGFLAMGDFYKEIFKEENKKPCLEKAMRRYLLASKIYNQLYLGEHYNKRLYTSYNAINERLLNVLETTSNENLLTEVINNIENNGSKLTWSKFVFNNQRQQLDLPDGLINKEDGIKSQLNFYQKALFNGKSISEDKITLWKNKIFELQNELSKIQDSIKQESKSYYQFNIMEFDITSFQEGLEDEEVVLKYVETETKLYSFLISNQTIKLQPTADKAKVYNNLKVCLNSLKNRRNDYQKSLNEFNDLFFNSMVYKKYKKLTIVPDGALHYFPFESLFLEKDMPATSYALSLLLYQEQKTIPSYFNEVKVGAFSASNVNSKLLKASDEVKEVANIFDGNMFLNASKTEFLKNANQFNILHLAMHSKINETHPEFSSLDFYGEEENQLFISELYNETFKANMVVLSACDTGNGFYENGEGVICLSRAFNYAGIPSTVMSLWKVDDESTEKIMISFYKHLNEGETKDDALKNAKLDYLKSTDDPLLKHPYYWAGFVLTGNTDALIENHHYWFYAFGILILLLFFLRKKLFNFFK